MACTLTFTCVPAGIRTENGVTAAYLDVLVTPSCDAQADVNRLLGWAYEVIRVKDGFHLTGLSRVNLVLETEHIKPRLWPLLFGDAETGPRSSTTHIAPNGSSLSDAHDLVRQFHDSAYKTAVNKQSVFPDVNKLTTFHQSAIDNHGLYMPHVGQPIGNTHAQYIVNVGDHLKT